MATPMKIRTTDETDGSLGKTELEVCKICLSNQFKYTCPRCNLMYCSVACYKDEKHMTCSEAFYKDCVIQELQDMKNMPEDKEKVLEMLKRDLEDRAADDEVCEDEEENDLSARLEGLDLDRDIGVVWGRLSAKEKEEFARMFQDGRLANLIEIWTPWWRCPENLKLVREEKSQEKHSASSMPEISDITDMNTLLKNSKPSSNCRYDMVNVLFAYAFVTRIHNGSHRECAVDSSQLMLEVCAALNQQQPCGSVGEAVQSALDCIDQVGKMSKESSPDFNLSIFDDLEVLIIGREKAKPGLSFMLAALSDLGNLFRLSLSIIKKEMKSNKSQDSELSNLQLMKTSIFKAEKKIMFYLSWLQRYGMSMHQMLPLLQLEKECRLGAFQEVKDIKVSLESNMDKIKPKSETTGSKITELS